MEAAATESTIEPNAASEVTAIEDEIAPVGVVVGAEAFREPATPGPLCPRKGRLGMRTRPHSRSQKLET